MYRPGAASEMWAGFRSSRQCRSSPTSLKQLLERQARGIFSSPSARAHDNILSLTIAFAIPVDTAACGS